MKDIRVKIFQKFSGFRAVETVSFEAIIFSVMVRLCEIGGVDGGIRDMNRSGFEQVGYFQ